MNHILFPITFSCNLSCKFCATRCENKSVDIDATLLAIKEKAKEIKWVYITGGEPFLVDRLEEVCKSLKSCGFQVGITTNGTIFKPEIAPSVDRIGISLDGDKEYHDAYRGEGVFDKALSLFHAIKDKCETVIMSTAFKENIDALLRLKPIVESLNPTYWQIQKDYFNNVELPAELEEAL